MGTSTVTTREKEALSKEGATPTDAKKNESLTTEEISRALNVSDPKEELKKREKSVSRTKGVLLDRLTQ